LVEEKEHEGNFKFMYNLHGSISLFKKFPMTDGTPRGSSQLRRYSFLKMTM
jgi:hypothetical protein